MAEKSKLFFHCATCIRKIFLERFVNFRFIRKKKKKNWRKNGHFMIFNCCVKELRKRREKKKQGFLNGYDLRTYFIGQYQHLLLRCRSDKGLLRGGWLQELNSV